MLEENPTLRYETVSDEFQSAAQLNPCLDRGLEVATAGVEREPITVVSDEKIENSLPIVGNCRLDEHYGRCLRDTFGRPMQRRHEPAIPY
jgi:hypothetical protein